MQKEQKMHSPQEGCIYDSFQSNLASTLGCPHQTIQSPLRLHSTSHPSLLAQFTHAFSISLDCFFFVLFILSLLLFMLMAIHFNYGSLFICSSSLFFSFLSFISSPLFLSLFSSLLSNFPSVSYQNTIGKQSIRATLAAAYPFQSHNTINLHNSFIPLTISRWHQHPLSTLFISVSQHEPTAQAFSFHLPFHTSHSSRANISLHKPKSTDHQPQSCPHLHLSCPYCGNIITIIIPGN